MSASRTRAALIAAGEALFAAQGIDGPSLREITRAAGQHNTRALQYHFTDRDRLLAEILHRHHVAVDAARDRLLDELASTATAEELAGALVTPLAMKLTDPDGGSNFLQIIHEVLSRPLRFPRHIGPSADLVSSSLVRWAARTDPVLPPEAVGPPLHRRFTVIRFVHTELAIRSRSTHRDHSLFTSHLIDMAAALLIAPVSERTASHIR